MQSNEYPEFKKALLKTFALYDKQLSDVVLSVWWDALQPYAFRDVTRALTAHIRNPDSGSYLPKPADVIRGLTGGNANAAQAAWTKVDNAVRRKGPYITVVFDDPVIHRVIADMGGWIRINSKTAEEWPFIQKEFETRYRGIALTGGTSDYPAKLTGMAEDQIQREGVRISAELRQKVAPIAFIGDPARAELVMQNGATGALVAITNRLTHEDGSEQASGPRGIRAGAEIVRISSQAQGNYGGGSRA